MHDKSVKDYLRLVTAEQLQEGVTPKQHTQFFVDKLTQLCSHLDRKLQDNKAIDRFIIALDQAYFKVAFFSGDRLGDLGQVKVLRFPKDADQHSHPYLILAEQKPECYENITIFVFCRTVVCNMFNFYCHLHISASFRATIIAWQINRWLSWSCTTRFAIG